MNQGKKYPAFRRSAVALAIALTLSAGPAIADDIVINSSNWDTTGIITSTLARTWEHLGGIIFFDGNPYTINQAINLPTAQVMISTGGAEQIFEGNISGNLGTYALVVNAPWHSLTLSGNNSFTGTVQLYSGKLILGSDTALGVAGNELIMSDRTTLELGTDTSGGIHIQNPIRTWNAGDIAYISSGNISDHTLAGPLFMGTLIKSGTTQLTLGVENSSIQNLVVAEGDVIVAHDHGLPKQSLAVRHNATFNAASHAGNIPVVIMNDGSSVSNMNNISINRSLTVIRESVSSTPVWNGGLDMSNRILNFVLQKEEDFINSTSHLLNVTGTAELNNATVRGILMGGTGIQAGDKIKLLQAGTLDHAPTGEAQFSAGGLSRIKFQLSEDADALWATATGSDAWDGSEAVTQGVLAGMSMLNTQGDLVASQGMFHAKAASAGGNTGAGGFAALGGGTMKQKTGSHADVDSFSLLAGAAYGSELDSGRMTVGGFIEYGKGNYNTYNSFVRGDGDAWNIGAGILGRMDFKNSLYAEGSARVGRLKNVNSATNLHIHIALSPKFL